MPNLFAATMADKGWMRLLVSFTDQSSVFAAKLERVVAATGVATPVRPHTAYSGWYQALGGGGSVRMYDTEAPLDTPFYYRLSSITDPDVYYYGFPWVRDTFNRVVAAGDWGTSSSGQVWTVSPGAAHSVASDVGRQTHSAVNSLVTALVPVGSAYQRIQVDWMVPVMPTGAGISTWVLGGALDAGNYLAATTQIGTTGVANLVLQKRIGSALQPGLGVVNGVGTHTPGAWWRTIMELDGGRIRVKSWNLSAAMPSGWQIDTWDTGPPMGTMAGVGARLENGNTNTLPVITSYDGFTANSLSQPADGVTYTLNSQGGFWLRSPLKPYKDRRVLLRPSRDCPPAAGTFFAAMDARETFASNAGTVSPANRRLAQSVSRPRRGLSSTLTVVSKTFADRDDLLDTLSDGTALQWVAPPEYGIPPMYVAVGDVDVNRGMSDHRFQARALGLPFTQVAQPAGPGAGITGARFKDLCKTYATWDAAATAGVTYDDMISVT